MKRGAKDTLKALGAAGAGAVTGAGFYSAIGSIGVAAGGAAIGITAGPFMAIGAGAGLAGYGLYWLGKQVGGGRKK